MINPRRHNHQIPPLQSNPHPIIPFTPDIEIPAPAENVSNFLVFVQVLVEEVFHFFFVPRERGGTDLDLVAVFVGAVRGDFVYCIKIVGELVVDYSEGGEVGGVD